MEGVVRPSQERGWCFFGCPKSGRLLSISVLTDELFVSQNKKSTMFGGVLSSFESIGTDLNDLDASRLSPEKSTSQSSFNNLPAAYTSEPVVQHVRSSALDEDLDKAQQLFKQMEATTDYQDDPRVRYLNPFLRNSSSDEE